MQNKPNELKIVHLNIRSLRKNFAELLVMINECKQNLDIILLSEINIRAEELNNYQISGYETYTFTRKTQRGGGLLLYSRSDINIQVTNTEVCASEMLIGKIYYHDRIVHLIGIYRPPNTHKHCFMDELKTVISQIPDNQEIILLGDVNLNLLETNTTPTVESYKNTLCEYGMRSIINKCTRDEIVKGRRVTSCIDHVWVRSRAPSNGFLLDCKLSDHYLVGVCLDLGVSVRMHNCRQGKVCVLNNNLVRDKLNNIEWHKLLQIDCPLELYSELCSVFSGTLK